LNGGTFDISAATDQTVKNLAGGSGTVVLGAHTLTVAAAAPTTFGGTIAGSGGLVKTGPGALTLTAASTTGGAWRIDQGTLALGGTTFQITYQGGSGHDIVLTAKSSASASTAARDASGTSAQATARPGGGSGFPLVTLVAALAALLVVGLAVLRVRRRPAARGTNRHGARRNGSH
jgi:autotransporter-associated beta strand protein